MMKEIEIGCRTDQERHQAATFSLAMTVAAEQNGITHRAFADAVCAMVAGIATSLGSDPLERIQALEALAATARKHLIDSMVPRGRVQ